MAGLIVTIIAGVVAAVVGAAASWLLSRRATRITTTATQVQARTAEETQLREVEADLVTALTKKVTLLEAGLNECETKHHEGEVERRNLRQTVISQATHISEQDLRLTDALQRIAILEAAQATRMLDLEQQQKARISDLGGSANS